MYRALKDGFRGKQLPGQVSNSKRGNVKLRYIPLVRFVRLDECNLTKINIVLQKEVKAFIPLGSSGGSNWTIQSTAGIWAKVSLGCEVVTAPTHIKPSCSYICGDQCPFACIAGRASVKRSRVRYACYVAHQNSKNVFVRLICFCLP